VNAVHLKRASEANTEETARKKLTPDSSCTTVATTSSFQQQPTLKEFKERDGKFPDDV